MIMTISSTIVRNANIRDVYLISYIHCVNGTDTAFHRTYFWLFNVYSIRLYGSGIFRVIN